MRGLIGKVGITLAGAGLMLGSTASSALDPYSAAPEPGAYLTLGFGGSARAQDTLSSLHAGLRLSHDRHLGDNDSAALPPVMQIDFTARGYGLRVNGLDLVAHRFKLGQGEGADTSAEEGIGAEEGASGTTYTATDWILLGVGVAGVVFLGAYAVSGEDKETPKAANTGGGGGGGGGGLCAPDEIPGIGGECLPIPFTATARGPGAITDTGWLDEGTGQMGDLQ